MKNYHSNGSPESVCEETVTETEYWIYENISCRHYDPFGFYTVSSHGHGMYPVKVEVVLEDGADVQETHEDGTPAKVCYTTEKEGKKFIKTETECIFYNEFGHEEDRTNDKEKERIVHEVELEKGADVQKIHENGNPKIVCYHRDEVDGKVLTIFSTCYRYNRYGI